MIARVIMLVFGLVFVGSAFAEQREVVQGGSLWDMTVAAGQPGENWHQLQQANPQLPPPKNNGQWLDVRVYPGNKLTIPDEWVAGVNPAILKPVPVMPSVVPGILGGGTVAPEVTENAASGSGVRGWLGWLWLLAVVIAVLALLRALRQSARRRNPDNYPPVIEGGLPENADEARAVLQHRSSRPIEKVECGFLRSRGGFSPMRVVMCFGDGTTRVVDLSSTDLVFRVACMDGEVEYHRQHCGNLTMPISEGRYDLGDQDDWEFVLQNQTDGATTIVNAQDGAPLGVPRVELRYDTHGWLASIQPFGCTATLTREAGGKFTLIVTPVQ